MLVDIYEKHRSPMPFTYISPKKDHHRSRQGFTLVELLAAVGIIAVLAALLTVGSKKVFETSRMSKSTGNLKQLASAAVMYAADNNNRLPVYANAAGDFCQTFLVRDYLAKNYQLLIAPGDRLLNLEAGGGARYKMMDPDTRELNKIGYSYAINLGLPALYPDTLPGETVPSPAARNNAPSNLTYIERPSETAIFLETGSVGGLVGSMVQKGRFRYDYKDGEAMLVAFVGGNVRLVEKNILDQDEATSEENRRAHRILWYSKPEWTTKTWINKQ